MPPWRTTVDMRSASMPVSPATIASASSADLRCCASKSGGTYSASITGVSGITLIRRTMPPDCRAISTALAIAGLARSASVKSTGTRICLYIAVALADCWRRRARLRRRGALPLHHATFARRREAPSKGSASLSFCVLDETRRDESNELSAAQRKLAPVFPGKVDHHETGRGQPVIELARLARGKQKPCGVVEAGIVADHQERGGG